MHPFRTYWGQKGPSYCPREGYKVASVVQLADEIAAWVTVPVRGIRLHQKQG